MNNQTDSTTASDEEIKCKVRAALGDPVLLGQIAVGIDPTAIRRGETEEALERAALLIMDAGRLCGLMSRDSMDKIVVTLAEHYEANLDRVASLVNYYAPKPAPADVLVLSEIEGKDTFRAFLRENANFEGKAMGKREAWKTTRMVKDNLKWWFISRANDHNVGFPDDWRDGDEEYGKAIVEWSKEGDLHIPRDQLLAPKGESEAQPPSPFPQARDWQFIPWRRRMKGRFKNIHKMTKAEVEDARKRLKKAGEKKLSEDDAKYRRQKAKKSAKAEAIPKRLSQK